MLAFLALVKAGLWEQDVKLGKYGITDFPKILRLAQEQSVVGLVAAGLEKMNDMEVPQAISLSFARKVLKLEQRNRGMNAFIGKLIKRLRENDIYALLVKGQGIAQCYEKPLWRACGDVDLYLTKDNYEKAKALLIPIATSVEKEEKWRLHLGMTIDGWVVELHGTMYTKLSRRMNRMADAVHKDIFFNGNVRGWNDCGVQVFLPSANNDVIIVFNHVINHFFMEGVGLRQICDWCRLLWCYRGELDVQLLEKRIKCMGLMTEWKAFASLAVDFLGMPVEAMPFYDVRFKVKGSWLMDFVMEAGNFGHNRDISYRAKRSAAVVNTITFCRRLRDFVRFTPLFPIDSPKFFCQYLVNRFTLG